MLSLSVRQRRVEEPTIHRSTILTISKKEISLISRAGKNKMDMLMLPIKTKELLVFSLAKNGAKLSNKVATWIGPALVSLCLRPVSFCDSHLTKTEDQISTNCRYTSLINR